MNNKKPIMLAGALLLSVVVISGIYLDQQDSEDEQRYKDAPPTDIAYKYGEELNETLKSYENQSYSGPIDMDSRAPHNLSIRVDNKNTSKVVKKINQSATANVRYVSSGLKIIEHCYSTCL